MMAFRREAPFTNITSQQDELLCFTAMAWYEDHDDPKIINVRDFLSKQAERAAMGGTRVVEQMLITCAMTDNLDGTKNYPALKEHLITKLRELQG